MICSKNVVYLTLIIVRFKINGTLCIKPYAITQSIVPAIVLLFAIVRRECAECIAQGHVTGVTPYCAMLRSLGWGTAAW